MTGCEQTSAQEKKIRPSFRPVPNGWPLGAKLKLTCRELTGSICMSLGVAASQTAPRRSRRERSRQVLALG